MNRPPTRAAIVTGMVPTLRTRQINTRRSPGIRAAAARDNMTRWLAGNDTFTSFARARGKWTTTLPARTHTDSTASVIVAKRGRVIGEMFRSAQCTMHNAQRNEK
jgi:hypothetical protein